MRPIFAHWNGLPYCTYWGSKRFGCKAECSQQLLKALSMFEATDKQLHWSQRIALVRHNFHAARRNGDFSFFKILQAHAFLKGTDYVATITSQLGDDADTVLNTLDNLNASVAYVFQDAYKNIYDAMKSLMMDNSDKDDVRAQLRADQGQQIQRADHAIDRIVNSATALIQLQQPESQNDVACAWILGATIVADAVSVCTRQMLDIDGCVGDFIALENSWGNVQASVESAVTALRGVFNLMALDEQTEELKRRSSSNISTINMLRKFSTVLGTSLHMAQPPPQYKKSRAGSNASTRFSSISTQSSPSALRHSVSSAVPVKMPSKTPRPSHASDLIGAGAMLTPIPATPGIVDEGYKFGKNSASFVKEGSEDDDPKDHYVRPKMYVLSFSIHLL